VPKTTPSQTFANIFKMWVDKNTPPEERDNAERKLDAWLKRNDKTRSDISVILAQAAADAAAAQPSPPPSDPRDHTPHPFEDPQFTPADLVEEIVTKYVTMKPHYRVIYALNICFSHVYTQFTIAPRVSFESNDPDSGKTTALEVAKHLLFRPNPEALGTGAAIRDFLGQGPGSVTLDELDLLEPEAKKALMRIWNLGHKRGAILSLKIKGERKEFNIYAPMWAAGIGKFLGPSQLSRAFRIHMAPYPDDAPPERQYNDPSDNRDDLNAVYSYLRHWAAGVELNFNPSMPPKLVRRCGDNARGLLSIADSCGPEWGRRAREALMILFDEETAQRPEIVMLRHGLAIFDTLEPELDQIESNQFNQELKRHAVPDAEEWVNYHGPSGGKSPHPIGVQEQAALLKRVGIRSVPCWPPGPRKRGGCFKGYTRAQFEAAWQKYGPAESDGESGSAGARLRLISPREA
jgi:hypothetical protein